MQEQFQYHDFLSVDVVLTQEHEELVVLAAHDAYYYEVFPVEVFPDDVLVAKTELATQQ